MPISKHEKMIEARERKEGQKRVKAAKVRLDLDKHHRELGGMFVKKVIFHCMPKKTGKTKKARHLFRNYHGPGEALFITVTEKDGKEFVLSKEGPFEVMMDRQVELDKLLIVREFGKVIIDDVHFLDKSRIIKIVNEFLSAVMTTKLVCFGTNANRLGVSYRGARHLETIADETNHDSTACHFCMQVGKTSFTKLIHERHTRHSSDCLVDKSEKNGFYVERDLCFGCRRYEGNEE